MPNFHIKRAKLDGYRNIRGTEAEFCDGLNIIIGPNGCGKSNFLWFLNEVVNDYSKLNFEFDAVINYYYPYGSDFEDTYQSRREIVKQKMVLQYVVTHEYSPEEEYSVRSEWWANNMSRISLLSYNIPIKIDCFTDAKDTKITELGFLESENVILQNIFRINAQNDIDKISFSDEVKRRMAEYTPIQDIKIKTLIKDTKQVSDLFWETKFHSLLYEFQTEDGEWYTWNELSDGTRRIVWLVLNILTTSDDIILIEEPELGNHPQQLFKLMEFIKEQSEHKQFIITTHSPEVLNVIESDELDRIKIARYDAERKTTVIENIPEKRQKLIQKYLSDTGQLSDYWVHVNLEGTHKWTK